jgi:hypothetical protein
LTQKPPHAGWISRHILPKTAPRLKLSRLSSTCASKQL